MKGFQNRLFKDFDVTLELQPNGKTKRVYRYRGEYVSWKKSDEEVVRIKRISIYFGILLFAMQIWSSLQKVPMNSSKLVGGFSLLSVAAVCSLWIGIWEFIRLKEKRMYKRDCKMARELILWFSMIYFILLVVSVILELVYIIGNGVDARSVFIILFGICSAVLNMLLFRIVLQLKYKTVQEGEKGSDFEL